MELNKEYNCIKSNSQIQHKQINIDKSFQETLEEYLDDIVRIVKCSSHSFVTACSINESTATICGKIEIQLTYLNSNSELLYTDFIEEFEEKFDITNISDKAFCNGYIYDKYCSYRLINQRRVDFHISSSLEASIYDEISLPSISKCDGLRLNSSKIDAFNIVNCVNSKIDVDETFDLPSNSNGISRIVSFTTNVKEIDTKSIIDKVYIKAQLELFVLYSDETNSIQKAEYTFEVSKIIDISGANEESIITANINNGCLYIKAKSMNNDTSGKIELYGDVCANLNVINKKCLDISTDGYIIGYENTNEYTLFEALIDGTLVKKSDKISTKIKFSKDIVEIISLNVHVLSFKLSNKKAVLELCVKAFVKLDDGNFDYLTTTQEVDCFDCNKSIISSSVLFEHIDYTISSSNSISLNMQCNFRVFTATNKKIKLLNDIKCSKKTEFNSVLTLYFASKNEKVWDIAKKFSSDVDFIMKDNNLISDTIEANQALLIPQV